ncbi:MAG: glycosyltransferase [Myxococcales bacterium 68-20]|nr:glycosyltransferase [Myxococcales bacterium]OJY26046.1 MAG: glycosyltransferase [Myxococcales bacterium 68-20]
MRIVIFCHSLASDWNHGNAHFLRGVVTELVHRGHEVRAYEDENAWSAQNLVRDHGPAALELALHAYPSVRPIRYVDAELDVDEALDGADLVLVHEWNSHTLVARIGAHRKKADSRYRLLFHDTHHRSVTDEAAMRRYDLSGYDGVLAFGAAVADVYSRSGWANKAFVWHEAADVRVFRPLEPSSEPDGDLVWIGNWGDDERTSELLEMLLDPIRDLGLAARVHGVRYPPEALRMLDERKIEYAGWLANFRVPEVFASFRVTVHVPRRPYVEALPGIPTIRVFEALACGIPLVSAPWSDAEGLFTPGRDYLVAHDSATMRDHLRALLSDEAARRELATHGLSTVLERHTCAHRVDELQTIARDLGVRGAVLASSKAERRAKTASGAHT